MNVEAMALEYHGAGCSVIPIRSDKKPHIPWQEYQARRADPEEIAEWFSRWPTANVGIVTGKVSGVDVVDCDSLEGEDKLIERLT